MPLEKSQPCGLQIQCDTIEYVIVKKTPKTKYTHSFARSAIAPQTIASDTPAKTTSNMYPAAPGISENHSNGFWPTAVSSFVDGKKPCVPISPLPSPNARPNPTAQ